MKNELKIEYFKDLISIVQRSLYDSGDFEVASLIKKAQLSVRFERSEVLGYEDVNYWEIAFILRYKEYSALKNRFEIEKKLKTNISIFHTEKNNTISKVVIEPIIERMINWKAVLPDTRESTIELINDVMNFLINTATGEVSYKEEGVEDEFQKKYQKLKSIAEMAGFDCPIDVNCLAEWWIKIKVIPTYAERRSHIQKLFFPLIELLKKSEYDPIDVDFNQIAIRSDIIYKAIEDAELFISQEKYDSAVDRVHTAFQGYIRELLSVHHITFSKNDNLSALYSMLHKFYGSNIQPADVAKRIKEVIRSGIGIINSVNEMRNNNTVVHPNNLLIQKREAQLVIRIINSIVNYLEEIEKSKFINTT